MTVTDLSTDLCPGLMQQTAATTFKYAHTSRAVQSTSLILSRLAFHTRKRLDTVIMVVAYVKGAQSNRACS